MALLLEVQGRIALSTRPVIESRARYRSEERRAALALGSIYTSLLVLGLIGGALFIALRERVYLKYAGFVLLVLVLLLAVNGHLYGLPVFDWLAWWRESLLFALGHLAAMAMLVLVRHFASLHMHSPRIDALLRIAAWACLALALPGLASLQQWAGTSLRNVLRGWKG